MEHLPLPIVSRFRAQEGFRHERYHAFITGKPCVACGVPGEAHHYGGQQDGRGTGHKATDQKLVPLCHLHHREVERFGRCKFEAKYQVDFDQTSNRYHAIYQEKNHGGNG